MELAIWKQPQKYKKVKEDEEINLKNSFSFFIRSFFFHSYVRSSSFDWLIFTPFLIYERLSEKILRDSLLNK